MSFQERTELKGTILPAHSALLPVSYFETLPKSFQERADLELHVEGKILPAHSALLCIHSSIFSSIISDIEATSQAMRPQAVVVPMTGDSHQNILALLAFIYKMSNSTANMPDMVRDRRARETAAQMAAPAHKYGFDDIVRYCDDSLSSWATVSHFSSSDITEWIAFAEDLKLEKTLAAFEVQLIRLKAQMEAIAQARESRKPCQIGQRL